MTFDCYVCRGLIHSDELPHTYHAEGCPLRDPLPHNFQLGAENVPLCEELSGCGEDVHESCCPTCTGQAF